jgi:hypothetical protein
MDDEAIIEKKLLERKQVSTHWRTGPNFRDSIEYHEMMDLAVDEHIHRLEAMVLSEHLADDYYDRTLDLDTPKSTWQMFKMLHATSWWLGWLVNRWPVKYNTTHHRCVVKVGRYVNYPEAHVPIRNLGHPYLYEDVRALTDEEIAERDAERARLEAEVEAQRELVEVYLLVEETIDDLAAATGLTREWFEDALAYDREFDLHSKIYVIPQEVV